MPRDRFEINPMNKRTNTWRKDLRIIQAMSLALAATMFFCGLCIGYLLRVG